MSTESVDKRMRCIAGARTRALSVVVASVLVFVDCGDDEAKEREAAQADQDARELRLVETQVVEKAYAEGRLGVDGVVRADMQRYVEEAIGAGSESPYFLRPDGSMITFFEQTGDQQDAFLGWMNGSEVQAVVAGELIAARAELRKKWDRER